MIIVAVFWFVSPTHDVICTKAGIKKGIKMTENSNSILYIFFVVGPNQMKQPAHVKELLESVPSESMDLKPPPHCTRSKTLG